MPTMSGYEELERRCALIFENHERMLDNKRRSDRRDRKAPHIKTELTANPQLSVAKRRIIRREFKYRLPKRSDSYIEALDRAIGFLLNNWQFGQNPSLVCIERGLLHLLYANNDFKRVHQAIREMNLDEICQKYRFMITELEDIWDNSSYHLHGPTNRDPSQLTPVNRYRIRDRVRCPTKQFVGVRKYKIDASSKRTLEATYSANQRPDREAKIDIVRETGLSYDTVGNWFKNRRQREKKRFEPGWSSQGHNTIPPPELRTTSAGSQESSEASSSVQSTQLVDFNQQPLMSDYITAHCLDPACLDPVWSNNDQNFYGIGSFPYCEDNHSMESFRFVETTLVQFCPEYGVCSL